MVSMNSSSASPMMDSPRRRLTVAALLAALAVVPLSAQDVLSRWLNRDADLTTGLSNAGRDLPVLDEEDLDAYGDPKPMR